jgi:hypothetical protein
MYPHVHVLETVKSDNAMLTDRWGEYVRSNDEHIYLFLRLLIQHFENPLPTIYNILNDSKHTKTNHLSIHVLHTYDK